MNGKILLRGIERRSWKSSNRDKCYVAYGCERNGRHECICVTCIIEKATPETDLSFSSSRGLFFMPNSTPVRAELAASSH